MHGQEIPIENLKTPLLNNGQRYAEPVLENEIEGIYIEHIAIAGENSIIDSHKEGCKTVYLFMKGTGNVTAAKMNYEIVAETILLPITLPITPAVSATIKKIPTPG